MGQKDNEVVFITGGKRKQNKIKRGRKRRGKGDSHEMFLNRRVFEKDHCGDDAADEDRI